MQRGKEGERWKGVPAPQDRRAVRPDRLRTPLADQPGHGEIAFWTADTGIDGQTPIDPGELDLVGIDPLPSWVWYQDMADFARGITDERAGRRLARAIAGKGALSRFKDKLCEEYLALLPACTRSGTPGPAAVPCNGWLTTR